MGRVMRWAAGMMVGAFVMTGAGCTDEPTQPTDLSDATSSATASETSEVSSGSESAASASSSFSPDEQAVVDQYKGYYNAIYTLTTPTDDEVRAAFTPYAEQHVVENWVKVFQELATEGSEPGGEIQFGPLEVAITGQVAVVIECRDGTSELVISSADKSTKSHGSPETKVVAELFLSDSGEWLVQEANATEGGC
ncbi:hypothetical protein [Blastococcus sp. Marseille-P5729]|uniref:hypothetical protein n=1 Tax=Blastococcus sp. Marseille-P5729 TaxID=2086582 RepID=UPI00131D1FCF|nr:hypothetical protein [Blastococcus sp. Marseille-P5729]